MPVQASDAGSSDKGFASKAAAAPLGTGAKDAPVHHWYDGDVRRAVRIDPGLVVEFDGAPRLKAAPAAAGAAATIDPAPTQGESPVFVDADSGNGPRALPGGVILTFERALTRSEVDDLLAPFDTRVAHPIGTDGRRWLAASPAGTASLDLANRLHENLAGATASPNWWQPRARK